MAHCTPNLNDQIALKSPSSSTVTITDVDSADSGSGRGLGCSSNGQIVACSFRAANSQEPGLKVYNGNGSLMFTDQSILQFPLTHDAERSAPVVFGDAKYPTNAVLAADDCHVALVEQTGSSWVQAWESAIPTCTAKIADSPVSPVLLGNAYHANLLLFQTNSSGTIYTYNLQTGTKIQSGAVSDAQGNVCTSNNTPAVNDIDSSTSDVYMIDLCGNPDGSTSYGAVVKLTVNLTNGSWTPQILALPNSFNVPSYSSPTFVNTTLPGCSTPGAVYFDSSPATSTGKPSAFWGLSADGTCYVNTLGVIHFPGEFKANAPYDSTNGGLWVWDTDDTTVHFLEVPGLAENTGKSFKIPIPANKGATVPSSAMSLSTEAATNDVVLTFGVLSCLSGQKSCQGSGVGYVLAENVGLPGSPNPPHAIWELPIPGGNYSSGQFPIVHYSDGGSTLPYVVFTGFSAGTYYVGCPAGGC